MRKTIQRDGAYPRGGVRKVWKDLKREEREQRPAPKAPERTEQRPEKKASR